MNISTLNPQKDPMGAAMLEYQKTGKASQLKVFSPDFDEDVIDVPYLFRPVSQMPALERKALELSRGRVLDVGAGSGCHSLVLQEKLDVTAIDISPLSKQVMQARGVRNVHCINLFDFRLEGPFDTILMLMNGTGIIGSLAQMSYFFSRMRSLLSHGGQILVDSSDLKYLYENEDGTYDIDMTGHYYGEVEYVMKYGQVEGSRFPWLYVDFNTLKLVSGFNGFNCELIMEGSHYDYLAKLTIK